MTEPTNSSNSSESEMPKDSPTPAASAPSPAPTAVNEPSPTAPAAEPKSAADKGESAKPDDNADKKKKKTKAPKVVAPGKWRRRFVRTFMFVIVVGLFLQILLWALLPWTLKRAAKFYDLDLTCDRPDLSLFNSDAGLWHVKVTQHGQPVASVDYCRADISILNLFRGKLIIQRLEADGVDLTVQRNEDGTIPLLKGILFAGPQPGSVAAPKTPAGKPAPIDLRAPVAIDALVLTHVRTHIVDQKVNPGLNTEVQMNLRLTDLASPDRPAKFSLQLIPTPLSTPLLDSVTLEAGCKKVNDAKSLEAYFSVSARGLHPKLLEGYLKPFGVTVTAEGVAMSARGTLAINVIPTNPDAITGAISLTQLAVTADNVDAATMKSVSIDLDACNASTASIKSIALADGTFLAERTAAGGFRVAGFEFMPGTAEETTPTTKPASEPSSFVLNLGEFSLKNFRASFKDAGVKPAADLEFLIDALSLKNITNDPAKPDSAITIAGAFSAPGILHDVKIDGSCKALATKKTFDMSVVASGIHPDALGPYFALMGVDSDLKSGKFTCKLTADVSLPTEDSFLANARLANIKFTDGQQLLIGLDDVKLTGIGLSPGKIRIDAIDVTGPHAAVRREKTGAILAAGFRLKPTATSPTVAPIASGPTTNPSPVHVATTQPGVNADTLAALPKVDIGRFNWTGVKLQLDDEAAPNGQPSALEVTDAGVELTGLHIDFDPKAPPADKPAHLHAFLQAPGIVGNIKLDGTIAQHSGGMVANLEVTGEKISAILAAPYLKALNIEPTLHDASIHAKTLVDVWQLDNGIGATLRASEFQLSDATGELLGADEAALNDVHLTADVLEIGEISLKKPRGQFAREQGGAISAVGFKLLPVPPVEKKSAFAESTLPGTAAAATQPTTEVPATQPSGPKILVLKKFSITGGAFAWTDRAVKPTAQITAHVDGGITGVSWGKPADPATIEFTLRADGIVDEAKISGILAATHDSAGTRLDISATGLRQGALASYLPPGMTIELNDGRFKTHIDAGVALNAKGGAGGILIVTGLDYREGKGDTPLFSLDSVKVTAPRIDIPGEAIDVDEITVAGVQAGARMGKDGTLHAMGLAIAPPKTMQIVLKADRADGLADGSPVYYAGAVVGTVKAIHPPGDSSHFRIDVEIEKDPPLPKNLIGEISLQTPLDRGGKIDLKADGPPHGLLSAGDSVHVHFVAPPTVAATRPAAAGGVALVPVPGAVPASPVSTDRSASAGPLVIAKPKYPLITLKKLDVNLKRFTLVDETRENVPPITISDLRFVSNKPIEALGKEAATNSPADLTLSLKIDEMIDSVKVNLQASPFAGEPTVIVDVTAAGIHGDGLIAQVPALKEKIDASQLTDGRFHLHAGAKIKMDRFDPLSFPLDRAFDVDTVIKNIEFRAADKGPVLIGVEEIRSEGIHVRPAEKMVTAKTLEIENIVGQASREKDGIHAMGIVLKIAAEPATQPTTAPADTKSASPETQPAPARQVIVATTAPAPSEDGEEIRITKVFVSGLDFRVADNTVSPPLLIPLNSLDVDIRNLSTKAFTEERPATRFSVLVGAGKVPLPHKAPPTSPVPSPTAGLAAIGNIVGGPKPAPAKVESNATMEDRDLFSQIQADGELTFFPQPKGWLKASVSAFDLAEFSSSVKPFKVELANGVFDEAIDARLPGDGTLAVEAHSIFTDLDLSEPENGPIRRTLRLMTPLNFGIGLLERADGSIDVPLAITIEKGKITTSEIIGAGINALGAIMANAAAAQPVKVVNGVGGIVNNVIPFARMLGLDKPKNNGPFTISFSSGDDSLSTADLMQLNILIGRMQEEPDLQVTMQSELTGGPLAKTLNLDQMTGDLGRARLRANPSQEECRELINRLSRRKDDLIRRRLDLLGEARGSVASRSPAESAASLERLRAVEREVSATEDALDRLYDMERPGAARQAGRRTKQAALTVARSRQKSIIAYLVASGPPGVADRINEPRPAFAPVESADNAGGSVVLTVTVKRKS